MTNKTYFEDFLSYLTAKQLNQSPQKLYEPINYILNLGGKRIRPIVALAACHLFDNDYQKALPAALAIEVFHNFTLVHDDIMDKADIRRGKPTVHKKYNTNQAILSGDLMQLYAYQILCAYTEPHKSPLLDIFTRTGIEVCEGQQWDMEFEERNDVTIDEYIQMIKYKTAVLLAASLQMGAIIGNASNQDISLLQQYGINIGLAFQIQDDFLDTFGETAAVGKKIGGDIQQNKKTILYLNALQKANPNQKARLLELYQLTPQDSTAKIAEVIQIFKDLNIHTSTQTLIEEYTNIAMDALKAVNVDENRKEFLYQLTAQLMGRKF